MTDKTTTNPATSEPTNLCAGHEGHVAPEKDEDRTSSDYYFDSYSHFAIHEEMLKDEVRTRTYQQAIINNKAQFKDKVVLDVGCGTGILCMFAAQAGAKKVIGVDMSGIVTQARQIIKANKFEDVITILHGKLEEIDLGVDKVDIIVSEWMGYNLFYENMLDTVLYARDKWLVPNGLILPDKASLYICGIESAQYKQEKISWWDDVYGFDMSCIKKQALIEPLVDTVSEEELVTDHCKLVTIDITTCTKEDLVFTTDFDIASLYNDHFHAFVTWFDVEFSRLDNSTMFPTGPHHRYTHWKQTIFYTKADLPINTGERIKGTYKLALNEKNPRDLDITIDFKFSGQLKQVEECNEYKMC